MLLIPVTNSDLRVTLDSRFASLSTPPLRVQRINRQSPLTFRVPITWMDVPPFQHPPPGTTKPTRLLDGEQWQAIHGWARRVTPTDINTYVSLPQLIYLLYPLLVEDESTVLEAWRDKPWTLMSLYQSRPEVFIRFVDGNPLNLQFQNLSTSPVVRRSRTSLGTAEAVIKLLQKQPTLPELLNDPPPEPPKPFVRPLSLKDIIAPPTHLPETSHVQPSTSLPPADHTLPSPTPGAASLPDEAGPGGPPPRRD